MKELIEYIACSLVDDPTQVEIDAVSARSIDIEFQLHVAKEDMGRVIGKNGRVANAMRILAERGGSSGGQAGLAGCRRSSMTSRSTVPPSIEDASSSPSGDAGSPHKGEPVFLAVGKLRRPHGLHGEIIMDVLTDFPERLTPWNDLVHWPEHQPLRLRSHRWHTAALLVTFEGYDTPEQAGELRNQIVYVTAADRPPLPEGEYYHHQLIGLQVISEQGEVFGKGHRDPGHRRQRCLCGACGDRSRNSHPGGRMNS